MYDLPFTADANGTAQVIKIFPVGGIGLPTGQWTTYAWLDETIPEAGSGAFTLGSVCP